MRPHIAGRWIIRHPRLVQALVSPVLVLYVAVGVGQGVREGFRTFCRHSRNLRLGLEDEATTLYKRPR